jgi:hypothetical protein
MCRASSVRVQEFAAYSVRFSAKRSVGPPVGQEFQLNVDKAVVLEHGLYPSHPILAFGDDEILMEQAHAPKAGYCCGLDPFPQWYGAAFVTAKWRVVYTVQQV